MWGHPTNSKSMESETLSLCVGGCRFGREYNAHLRGAMCKGRWRPRSDLACPCLSYLYINHIGNIRSSIMASMMWTKFRFHLQHNITTFSWKARMSPSAWLNQVVGRNRWLNLVVLAHKPSLMAQKTCCLTHNPFLTWNGALDSPSWSRIGRGLGGTRNGLPTAPFLGATAFLNTVMHLQCCSRYLKNISWGLPTFRMKLNLMSDHETLITPSHLC